VPAVISVAETDRKVSRVFERSLRCATGEKWEGSIIRCNEFCISRVAMDVFMVRTDSKSHPLLSGTVRRVASMAEEHRHNRGSTSS
jgi:hypothetical protein